MIHYMLECEQGHSFEGWFASSESYDEQVKFAALTCPMCNTRNVQKAIMSPAIGTLNLENKHLPKPTHNSDQSEVIYGEADETFFFAKLQKIREELTKSAENVGERFPEVARQIHYNEIAPKSIYGQTTLEEAYHLAEEGVEFISIPSLPDRLH